MTVCWERRERREMTVRSMTTPLHSSSTVQSARWSDLTPESDCAKTDCSRPPSTPVPANQPRMRSRGRLSERNSLWQTFKRGGSARKTQRKTMTGTHKVNFIFIFNHSLLARLHWTDHTGNLTEGSHPPFYSEMPIGCSSFKHTAMSVILLSLLSCIPSFVLNDDFGAR